MPILIKKSIYDNKSKDDGYRVLVMRYWSRGIKKSKIDLWLRDLGTSKELIKLWKAKKIEWTDFRERYLAELNDKKRLIRDMKFRAESENVTLLCSCKDPMSCHRSVLKEEIEKST